MTSPLTVDDAAFAKALADVEAWRRGDRSTIEYEGFPDTPPSVVPWKGDPESFLSLIDRLTPTFAYIEIDELSADDVEALAEEVLSHQVAEPGEGDEELDDFADEDLAEDPEFVELVSSLKTRLADGGHEFGEPNQLRIGFVRDGILHSLAIEPSWFAGFIDSELAVALQREEEAKQRDKDAFDDLKSSGFFDEVASDKRMFGLVSNISIFETCWILAIERQADLARFGEPVAMRRTLHYLVPDLPKRVTAKKAEAEQAALSNLEAFGTDFFADPAVSRASTVSQRERLAKAYVEERLGFKSPAVVSQLARVAKKR